MPRIRTIKPSFARHEELQELECSHAELRPMLTFACLWMVCDREGRFEWKPKQLKLDIMPFVPFDLAATLDLLASRSFIVRYQVDGKTYGHIPSWGEHQHVNVKESASTIPAPPKHVPSPAEHHTGPVLSRGEREGEKEREGEGESDAMALPPLALAQKVAHECVLPRNPGMIQAIAGAIEFCVKTDSRSPNSAVEFLITESKAEIARGRPPNKFWFDDRKWKPAKANGKSKLQEELDVIDNYKFRD